MTRWLKRIAKFLLLALLALGAGFGVWVFHTLPMVDGALKVAGLSQRVQINRDTDDVVHIQAQSSRDAAFALGFAHAQDRSWQLEFNRRLMHGELSEILGEVTLPTDKLIRTLGLMQAAQRQYDNLPAEVREQLQAYSDGINSFHANRPQGLPPEFALLRTEPGGTSGKPWQPIDSVAWSLVMALDLGGNWGNEFARLTAARSLSTEQLWQLYPPYPGEKPATAVDLAQLYRNLGVYKPAGGLKTSLSLPVVGEPGFNEGRGSNNWVVAGSHTTSGKPLLANDPHLALSAPAIWYYAHLQAPDLNVIGASLPGLPFVVLGRNEHVAWGFTNTGPDVQDLYLEQIDPADPNRYKTPTGWQAFETRQETIAVKGQPSVTQVVRSTRHGPVISDAQASHGEVMDLSRFVLALRWTALDADNRTLASGFKVPKAKNVPELIAAFADNHSPTQNIVMADREGRIAFKAAGRVPLRRADNDLRGVAPAPGWDARYDWSGWIPYAEMPQDDGKKGWVATANQRITAPGYAHFLGQDWTAPHRYDRIEQVLSAKPRHSFADMQGLQKDDVSLSTLTLLPVLKATPSQHPLAAQARKTLDGFDGRMSADLPAPLLVSVWADELTRGLIEPKLGADTFKAQYGKRNFRVFLENVMRQPNSPWCAPKSCAEQSTAALDRALDRIAVLQGNTPADWRWGREHVALSTHRPFGQVPYLRDVFNVSVPSDGDPFTVNVGQYWPGEKYMPFANRHAASMRAVYDLSDLEQSQFIYQTGQSGLVWSTNYRDMKDAWARGQTRDLRLTPKATTHTLTLAP
ncbi:COG2366 Protein related to penicillin acylase [Burkholderiaceae bacterium]